MAMRIAGRRRRTAPAGAGPDGAGPDGAGPGGAGPGGAGPVSAGPPRRGWSRLKVFAATGAGVLGAASAAVGVQTWLDTRLQPPLTVRVEHLPSGPCYPGWIIPAGPEELGAVPPAGDPADLQARARWAEAHGGVDAERSTAEITVQGTGDRAIILTGLTVSVVDRAAPLSGIQVAESCGDALWARYFEVDLDQPAPAVGPSLDNRMEVVLEGAEPPDPIDFPYTVTAGDPELFQVVASTTSCYCEWTATLHWRDGDDDGRTEITDGGEPFRVSAIGSAPQYGNNDGGPLLPTP